MTRDATASPGPRLLVAIFSHERFVTLRNLLKSIECFIGNADVYVFDDHSPDPRIGRLLKEKANATTFRWTTTDKHAIAENRLGGLYENLNRALRIGIEEEYDLLLLLQDDHQILWFDSILPAQVHAFFDGNQDALMLDPRFIRRIQFHSSYGGDAGDAAISMRRGAVAVGFISPKRAEQIGFRFGHSERESSNLALKLGKRCYKCRLPFVADIPVMASFHLAPPFFRGRLWRLEDEDRFACEPILEPLSENDVNLVKTVPMNCAIFAEDVVRRTDGHAALYPHSYNTSLFGRYRILTTSAWLSEFRRIGRVRRLEPLPPPVPYRRSPFRSFSLRMQQQNRLWSYAVYLIDTCKTVIFFALLYPIIRAWMRRESNRFTRKLKRS